MKAVRNEYMRDNETNLVVDVDGARTDREMQFFTIKATGHIGSLEVAGKETNQEETYPRIRQLAEELLHDSSSEKQYLERE